MGRAIQALLNQIIDYAGLFPPAKLPLEPALQSYLRDRKSSPHRWMLGRFVCPTARLAELRTLAQAHPDATLLSLTALGQQGSTAGDFLPRLMEDLTMISDFRREWGSPAVADMYEVALPKDADLASLEAPLVTASTTLRDAGLRAFFEMPQGPGWRENINRLTATLQPTGVGLKLRCGGLTADAFPTDEQVAYFIAACRTRNLAWKATAGLHHPRRHWDASLQTWHHGFLNVFLAGMLAPTNVAAIAEILADREGRHFRFDDSTIAWKDWSCTTEQIAECRATSATTFGSCSFAEPCQDLLAMGLLKGA